MSTHASYKFSEKSEVKFKELEPKFPERMSLTIPALHLVQEDLGYVPEETLDYVAKRVGVSTAHVKGVFSFYTMFNKKPVGKYHLQVCHNVSCWLAGSDSVEQTIEKKLGIKSGETTEDKMFTFSKAECLASCGTGPVVQVNNDYHEQMTIEKLEKLIDDLKNKG